MELITPWTQTETLRSMVFYFPLSLSFLKELKAVPTKNQKSVENDVSAKRRRELPATPRTRPTSRCVSVLNRFPIYAFLLLLVLFCYHHLYHFLHFFVFYFLGLTRICMSSKGRVLPIHLFSFFRPFFKEVSSFRPFFFFFSWLNGLVLTGVLGLFSCQRMKPYE